MVQIARPSSTIIFQEPGFAGGTSGWRLYPASGYDAHELISDEEDEDTFIYHTGSPGRVAYGLCGGVTAPLDSGSVTFSITHRARIPGFSGALCAINMGTAADGIIATRTLTSTSDSWSTTTYTLTSGEQDSVTDWSSLAWRFAYQSGTARQFRVSEYWITTPDAAPVTSKANKWFSGWRHG